jgi:2'-5' RNA ligase
MAATAIVVPVSEAEPATELWRRQYTRDGADGMPPHVTLLYPFVDDSLLVAGQVRTLRNTLAEFQPFEFVLAEFAEFPASATTARVLYLAPEPHDPFREMTHAISAPFPDYPPYGGRFATVVPHLTIAEDDDAPLAEIRARVAKSLPIRAQAAEAQVMRLGADGWRTRSRILLGRSEGHDPREPLFL